MNSTQRIDRIVAIAIAILLTAGCIVVLYPFISALLWTVILCFVTWPAFLVLLFVARVSMIWLGLAALVSINLALWTVVALLAAASALRLALDARAVDRERLYAGLSAYLLAGVFFGVFYWVIEQTWSGSFAILSEDVQNTFSLTGAIYYSFVTLATLGYGDIVPRSEAARGLAIIEAVAGQLYL